MTEICRRAAHSARRHATANLTTSVIAIMLAMTTTIGLTACSETPSISSTDFDPSTIVGGLHLSPEAAVIAAGGTQQLTVTATALNGTPITEYGDLQFVSGDSGKVTVSQTGLVTARTGSRALTDVPVPVVVISHKDGVTRADTAYVAVVPTVGSATTFSLADPSSAIKVSVNDIKSVTPAVTYFNGTTTVAMDGLTIPIKIHVAPTTLAQYASPKSFLAIAASGQVTVSATTTIFGTPYTDSVTYTLGDPRSVVIRLYKSGLQYLQGNGSPYAGFPPTTTFYLQVGGELDVVNWASFGPHTVGATCTATDGGIAPPPVTGIPSDYGGGSMTFTTAGRYSCDWTSDGIPDFPTDGSLHFFIVVR
jgi:hypothetical protein